MATEMVVLRDGRPVWVDTENPGPTTGYFGEHGDPEDRAAMRLRADDRIAWAEEDGRPRVVEGPRFTPVPGGQLECNTFIGLARPWEAEVGEWVHPRAFPDTPETVCVIGYFGRTFKRADAAPPDMPRGWARVVG